jgi:hypothetical protein
LISINVSICCGVCSESSCVEMGVLPRWVLNTAVEVNVVNDENHFELLEKCNFNPLNLTAAKTQPPLSEPLGFAG